MLKRGAALLGLTLALSLMTSVAAAAPFAIPIDAQRLMPADVAAIVAAPSVDRLVDEFATIADAFGDENTMDAASVRAAIDEQLGVFTTIVDQNRPLFLASGLPNPMAAGEMPLTMILPLAKDAPDLDSLPADESGFGAPVREGGYFAVSMSAAYVPAGRAPAIAAHLPDGVLAMNLDLEQVFLNFRPFVEMGLAGIPTREAGTPPDSTGAVTPAEAAAMARLARNAMDSVTRLDLAIGRRDELVTLVSGFGIQPGSILDPGPQPDFARAVALTGALPPAADLVQVLALDQTRSFEAFREYYTISMSQSVAAMGIEDVDAFKAWVERYLDNMDLWAQPMASALRTEGESMAGVAVLESDDAEAAVAELSALITDLGKLDIGYTLTPRADEKVAGVKFQSWDIGFDVEKFEATMPQGANPSLTGTARMQAEQMIGIMQKILPRMYVGSKDGRVFLASDDDTEDLAMLVKQAGKGKPHADVVRVADQAGPHCQQVMTGDLLTIVRWVTDIAADLAAEDRIVLEDNPIPFQGFVTVDGADVGFEMGMDLVALGKLVAAFEALED